MLQPAASSEVLIIETTARKRDLDGPSTGRIGAAGVLAGGRHRSGFAVPADGRVAFAEYVAKSWWPSRLLEVSTRAAYRSYLDTHFLPYFGQIPIASTMPSTVQAWVSFAHQAGLSPRSIRNTTSCCTTASAGRYGIG